MERAGPSVDSSADDVAQLRAANYALEQEKAELQARLGNATLEIEDLRVLAAIREQKFDGLQSSFDDVKNALETIQAKKRAAIKPWKPEELIEVISLEKQTQIYAEKVLEQLNADNLGADFVIEELLTSNVFLSRGKSYVHLNFTAKDADGAVHLLFGETTYDGDVLSYRFLPRDDSSQQRKGCGGCDPESEVPDFHPLEGFKHGNGHPYRSGLSFSLDKLAGRLRYV